MTSSDDPRGDRPPVADELAFTDFVGQQDNFGSYIVSVGVKGGKIYMAVNVYVFGSHINLCAGIMVFPVLLLSHLSGKIKFFLLFLA